MSDLTERILYEDNHLIIINKKASEIVQGDKTGDISLLETVREYVRVTYNKTGNVFTGLVHRLDRPVSGAVVFAKTGKSLTRMNQLVKERSVEKKYLAIVQNRPPLDKDELTHFLVKNEKQNKSYVRRPDDKAAKPAKLAYKVLAKSERFYILEIMLHTGRHHQIRAQLASIGSPIRGDVKYGYARPNTDGSINLHAWKLHFIHPVKQTPIDIVAPLPDEKPWNLFKEIQLTK